MPLREKKTESAHDFFLRIRRSKRLDEPEFSEYESDMYLSRVEDGLIGKVCLCCGNPDMSDSVKVDECKSCWTKNIERYIDKEDIDRLYNELRLKMENPKFDKLTDKIIEVAKSKGMIENGF